MNFSSSYGGTSLLWRPALGRRRGHVPAPPQLVAQVAEDDCEATSSVQAPSLDLPLPTARNGVRLATWNVHSLGNKFVSIADTILSNDLDLLLVTESWHRSSLDVAVRRSSPPGYSFVDCP